MELTFTDAEIGVIAAVLQRADPMSLIGEAQSALAKIRAYGEAKAQAQATEAAETPADG